MMKKQAWKPYAFWILLSEATGLVSAWISRGGMERFAQTAVQSSLSPPAPLFPVVWTLLYALMGISAARISQAPASAAQVTALNLFVAQLIVNFFWTPIFFNTGAYGLAFLWLLLLIVLVIWMILRFRKVDLLAAWLQIPYLLWLLFAAFLNFRIWQLNS